MNPSKIEPSFRVRDLPPYLFREIDEAKRKLQAQGRTIMNLGIGDPDLPTPQFVVDAMSAAIKNAPNHRYPDYEGSLAFRQAVAGYLRRRFRVEVDPATEVTALIGSKEGLAHFCHAMLDPGDLVLVPEPAYPVYAINARFAGAEVMTLPLLPAKDFKPDFAWLSKDELDRAKILFLNYPNNPTGALVDRKWLEDLVLWARTHNVILAYDCSYAEIVYNDADRLTPLMIDGAKDCTIEFHSLSKSYNMTGWRIGFAVGNPQLVQALLKYKMNLDSGPFTAVQDAAIAALSPAGDAMIEAMNRIYAARAKALTGVLHDLGWPVECPRGTFYLWAPVPEGFDSIRLVKDLLNIGGIVTTPGVGFGAAGEGYIRFALTLSDADILAGRDRFAKVWDQLKPTFAGH